MKIKHISYIDNILSDNLIGISTSTNNQAETITCVSMNNTKELCATERILRGKKNYQSLTKTISCLAQKQMTSGT